MAPLLWIAFLPLPFVAPAASADETHPDCEAGQPWIGYNPFLEAAFDELDQALPGDSFLCEGEHWDGQDAVGGSDPDACAGSSGLTLSLGSCLGADPNQGEAMPARARASREGGLAERGEAYAAADVLLVSREALYVGYCVGPSSGCGGAARLVVGAYFRDNTVGNLVWTVVSATRVEKGHVSEADCDQASYQAAAATNDPSLCGRDNTAATVELVIP